MEALYEKKLVKAIGVSNFIDANFGGKGMNTDEVNGSSSSLYRPRLRANRKRTSINPSSLAVAEAAYSACPLHPSPHRPAPPPALQGDGSNLLEEFIAHPGVKVMPAVHQYETHPLNVMDAMSETCRGAGELGR